MFRRLSVLVLTLSVLALANPAFALTAFAPRSTLALPQAGKVTMGGLAPEPFGHFLMCRRSPEACRAMGRARADDGRLVLTESLYATIESVNSRVNRSIAAVNEPTGDTWRIGVRSGDCEDFALTKRSRLLSKGLPSSALTMATGTTNGGIRHAVLVVRTDHGDFVLDNLTNAIKPWNQSSLRLEAIQSPSNPRIWRRI